MRLSWLVSVLVGVAAPAAVVGGGAAPAAARPACGNRPAGQVITLRAADDGRAVCAHRGQRIEVVLQVDADRNPAPEQWWRPVDLSGNALTALPQTRMAMRGTTLASYSAAGHGTATLASYRSVCAPPPPGFASCMAMQGWSVRVQVR